MTIALVCTRSLRPCSPQRAANFKRYSPPGTPEKSVSVLSGTVNYEQKDDDEEKLFTSPQVANILVFSGVLCGVVHQFIIHRLWRNFVLDVAPEHGLVYWFESFVTFFLGMVFSVSWVLVGITKYLASQERFQEGWFFGGFCGSALVLQLLTFSFGPTAVYLPRMTVWATFLVIGLVILMAWFAFMLINWKRDGLVVLAILCSPIPDGDPETLGRFLFEYQTVLVASMVSTAFLCLLA